MKNIKCSDRLIYDKWAPQNYDFFFYKKKIYIHHRGRKGILILCPNQIKDGTHQKGKTFCSDGKIYIEYTLNIYSEGRFLKFLHVLGRQVQT